MGSPIAYSIELGVFMAALRARRITSPPVIVATHSPTDASRLSNATFKCESPNLIRIQLMRPHRTQWQRSGLMN
jgi:hypothetical protein